MKRIFRSIIDVKSTIEQKDLIKNYRLFLESNIKPEENSYIKLYTWLEAHHKEFGELPSMELLIEKAKRDGEETILVSLTEISEQQPYIGSNYRAILKEKYEEQNKGEFQKILTSAWDITLSGKVMGKGKSKRELKGIGDAIEYVHSETRKFRMKSIGLKTEGNIRTKEEAQEIMTEYEKTKADPLSNIGIFTNFSRIDSSCRGLRIGELMLVAAFVAQGKTTISANLAYSAILQGKSGLYVPLEMTYDEMRQMFGILHTSNPDWLDQPKFRPMVGKMSYNKLIDGEFDSLEENFFRTSLDDFVNNPDYGQLYIYQPSEPLTPSLLELRMYDYHAMLIEKGKNLDFVVVDYVGLMHPDKSERYGDHNIDLNMTIKKLKNLALGFDSGRGTRMITPFQVNREGWKEAEKNDGVYKLTALSYANEAERSSDLVVSLYMTEDMKRKGLMKICCLKNRRRAAFNPFEASINFESKFITDIIRTSEQDADSHLMEIPMDIPIS